MDSYWQYIQTQAFISPSWWQYAFNGEIGLVPLGSYLCLERCLYTWWWFLLLWKENCVEGAGAVVHILPVTNLDCWPFVRFSSHLLPPVPTALLLTGTKFCLHETRTLWDHGESGSSPVDTVAPTTENISMKNISMENRGMLHSFSSRHLSANSQPPCELTAKEEFQEGKVQEAQICQVSCPYLHSQVHPPSWYLQLQPHRPLVPAVTVSVVLWSTWLMYFWSKDKKLVWICD